MVRCLNSLEIGSGRESMRALTDFTPGQESATSVPNILETQRLCNGSQAFEVKNLSWDSISFMSILCLST